MKLRQAKKVSKMLRLVNGMFCTLHRLSTADKAHRRLLRYRHAGQARPEFSGMTIWLDEASLVVKDATYERMAEKASKSRAVF